MSRFRSLIVGLLLATAWSGLDGQSRAEAGTFTVKQCDGSNHLDFQGVFGAVNGSLRVAAVNGCSISGPGKIGVYQDRSGVPLSWGEGGQFVWRAPPGTRVIATQFSARLKDANGIVASLEGFDGNNVVDLDGGVVHDGSQNLSSWTNTSRPQTLIVARLICRGSSGCANGSKSTKAFMEVTDAEFTVLDTEAPSTKAAGELWDWGADSRYHRGSASIGVDSSDQGAGVAAVWAEVNGFRTDLPAPACAGDRGGYATRFAPCPATYSSSRTFDTSAAPFREGANQIRVCSRDYAASESGASKSCTATRTVRIDNEPSRPPVNLRTEQGEGWQPENEFRLSWGNPGGQIAPVIGAVYLLEESDKGHLVDAGFLSEAGSIEVPDVGAYRAIVHLVDQAGNLGEPADTALRYDDRPPGDVRPEAPAGWISRDEMPIRQRIERAEPGGPSGIAGYALSVSKDGPTSPCGFGVCSDLQITLSGGPEFRTGSIGGLSEGSHWISATAVSGARVPSIEPGSTVVRVDRTPPTSSISGVPGEWVNRPVTVTVRASDQLSGMQPVEGDDGRPKTVVEAENYAAYEAPGPVAKFTVATEGVNRIRYWAEDLAGNANDGEPGTDGDTHPAPGQSVVRIDTTPPRIAFEQTRDPEDPETVRVSAEDRDSGVGSVSVLIRKAGTTGAFQALSTHGGDGEYRARVPSDDLTRGTYELRATAEDRAGNRVTGSETRVGEPMILTLPLKRRVLLTARMKERNAGYGSRPVVEGRLTSEGRGLADQPVRIVETFAAGSRKRTAAGEVRTDGDGRYRVKLGKGPSRRVEARFEGTGKLSRASGISRKLRVKGQVRFLVKPAKLYNGGVARMKGSVGFNGVLPPARGKLVAIQYLDPTRRKWRPVEVLRTNREGRFRYRYRFRTIGAAQRIVFRAISLPEAGWPYLPSTSKPGSVIVYPTGNRAGKEAA